MRGPVVARYRPLLVERLRIAHFFSTTQRMILRNLERRPIRALVSMFGIGLALSVMLVGLSLLDSVREMIDLQYSHLQHEDVTVVFEQARAPSAIAELERTAGVSAAEAYRVVPIRITHGHRSALLGLTGLSAGGTLRPLQTADRQPRRPPRDGIALTDRVAERLQIRVGDIVTVRPLERPDQLHHVRVVTLIDEIMGINAYMELSALSTLLREPPVVSGAYLRLQPQAEADVLTALRKFPGVRGVASKNAMLRTFNDQLARSLGITMSILTVLAAVLGVGVVYNGARIALSERATELASLRVLGFTSREVGWMLLGEQAVLTISGIPLGWLIGYGVAAIVVGAFNTQVFRVPLVVSTESLAWASTSTILIAAAAGFLVRRRLVQADPVIVLKTRE
jgi:putative ABC transport system permease protein